MARRYRRRNLPDSENFVTDNPFLAWYASYTRMGQAESMDRVGAGGDLSGDLFMGEVAARRFSIGVDDDGAPILGIAEGDAERVMSVEWTAAAFLRRVQGRWGGRPKIRDWIVLSSRDARAKGSGNILPIGLRLWLPTMTGLLDGWIESPKLPGTLKIVEAAIRKGKPEPRGGDPIGILPLSFKGSMAPNATAVVKTTPTPRTEPPAASKPARKQASGANPAPKSAAAGKAKTGKPRM